jgi:tetratricopeptide (TPR) repeat protein
MDPKQIIRRKNNLIKTLFQSTDNDRPFKKLIRLLTTKEHKSALVDDYEQYVKEDINPVLSVYLQILQSLMASNLYPKSVSLGSILSELFPKEWIIHHLLGMIYEIQNDNIHAKSHYAKSLSINPNDNQSKYQLALMFHKDKQYGKSMELLDELMKDDSDKTHAEYFTLVGTNLKETGHYDGALNAFEEASKVNPKDPIPHINIGVIYYNYKEEIVKAKQKFKDAIKLHKEEPDPYFHLGNIAMMEHNFRLASKFYERCLKYDPNDEGALKNMQLANQLEIREKEEKNKEITLATPSTPSTLLDVDQEPSTVIIEELEDDEDEDGYLFDGGSVDEEECACTCACECEC